MKNKNYTMKCGRGKKECPKNSINFGLCMNNKDFTSNCSNLNYDYQNKSLVSLPQICVNDVIEYNNDIIRGKEKGYAPDHFLEPCINNSEENTTVIENQVGDTIPSTFSIVTLNAMGIYRGEPVEINNGKYNGNNPALILMSLRAKIIRDYLTSEKPDIICFQEMSQVFLDLLYTVELKKIYPHYYEKNLNKPMTNREPTKDIEVFIMTKYEPKKVSVYALKGNLNYTCSLGIYEFNNLVIFNAYMQAGSKNSAGQKYFWKNYSRCRGQQFSFIKNLIEKYKKERSGGIILLGDFNFDINVIGTPDKDEWPESNVLKNIGLTDSWLSKHKSKKHWGAGLTENTEINTMRFNSKLEEKMYRYDGVFFNKDKMTVVNSKTILTDGVNLADKYNYAYENEIIPKFVKSNEELMRKIKTNHDGGYDIFASDHFGVYSSFRYKKLACNNKTKKIKREFTTIASP